MKPYYTAQEVFDDVQRFEGVTVGFPALVMSSIFLRLYSECHAKPLSSNSTVDDLKERVAQFLGNRTWTLLNPDVIPEISKEGLLYGYIPTEDVDQAKTVFLGQFNMGDSLGEVIGADVIAGYPQLLYVHLGERVITTLHRQGSVN